MHWMWCDIARYELELKPTGEVEQYSASATYELLKEDKSLVDTLKFLVQAEGGYPNWGCCISALFWVLDKGDIFVMMH